MGGGGGSFLDLGGSAGPLCEDTGVFGGEFSCDGVLVEGRVLCGVVAFVLGLGLGRSKRAPSASVVQ